MKRMTHPLFGIIQGAIEQAARQCVPWPNETDWDAATNTLTPMRLEQFASDSRRGQIGRDEAFAAAADAATNAVLQAIRGAGYRIEKVGDPNL